MAYFTLSSSPPLLIHTIFNGLLMAFLGLTALTLPTSSISSSLLKRGLKYSILNHVTQ